MDVQRRVVETHDNAAIVQRVAFGGLYSIVGSMIPAPDTGISKGTACPADPTHADLVRRGHHDPDLVEMHEFVAAVAGKQRRRKK